MTELKALGLAEMDETTEVKNGQSYNIMQITLKQEFNWFLTDEFKNLKEGFEPNDDDNDTTNDNDNHDVSKNDEKIDVTKGEIS